MREAASDLERYISYFHQTIPERIAHNKERLEQWVARIPARVQMRLQHERFKQERMAVRINTVWQTRLLREEYRLKLEQRLATAIDVRLQRERHRLQLAQSQVEAASPELLLKRGYSLTLKDGKAVTDASALHPGDVLTTRVAKGEFKSKVL